MAFTEFCCRSGGSNLNAGTRTGNSTEPGTAANLTYASGTWVSATGVFTPASGDPSADGVAVGDFASVYADGATVTTLVGRVTARTTTTITVSTTAKSGGTTDGTSNRTLKIGGAWQGPNGTSGFPLTFLTVGCTNAAADPVAINLKNDATYSITAAIAGVASSAILTQGYTTSYHDGGYALIDGGTSGASYTLFTPNATGTKYFRSLKFGNNGATGSADGVIAGDRTQWSQCVFFGMRGSGFAGATSETLHECEAYGNNLSNTAGKGGFVTSSCFNCISHDNTGSNTAGFVAAANGQRNVFVGCIADTNGSVGFSDGGLRGVAIINCDAYNNTGSGISITGSTAVVHNCNLIKNGGWGIASTAAQYIAVNCGIGSGTQANASGSFQLDQLVSGTVTYASNVTPWTDPANGDFRISLAAAQGTGRGSFTQTAASYAGTVGYPDIGAAQSQASGSSGIPIARGMHGGMR